MAERNAIRRGYDELAVTYAERRTAADRELAILETFLDSLSGPARLLDAGCGHGTPVLRRLAAETTAVGLDFSGEQLGLAVDAVPTAQLVQGDMTALPFRNGAFDAVTAFDSLIHVPLADHGTVVDEFARVLRPGGQVLLSEAPEAFERTNPDWLDGGVEMEWHMVGAATTREQLRDAGFVLTDEWAPPDEPGETKPEPPFFAARLDS